LAGIDISPKAIAVASEKLAGLGADLRVQDAEAELPWPDETFDAAAMTATIHHFPHLESSTIVVSRPARKDGPRSWRSLPSPRDGKWAAARAWQPDRSESSSHRVSAALIRAGSCATNICSARREE